uniref:Uncharacterized protein n=1 Tax=Romanomermis culicivorax TaxID=13658 RepID=A0A915K2C7_ROMCU
QTPSFNTSRNINKENYTKAPSYYRREFKNLTELCSAKIEPHGCFYHKNVYPDDCFRTRCNSIIVNIVTRNVNRFDWYYTEELATMDVEDWTPCMPGKLCIGGECIEHPDASHYVAPEAHPGGVRETIDHNDMGYYLSRSNISNFAIPHPFPSKLILNEIAVRFLSCSNPYPVNMDPGCF